MKLGSKIIIVGFILFAVGIVGMETRDQSLSSESIHLSDIPLWIRLAADVPTYLIHVGIITIIAVLLFVENNTLAV